MSTAGCPKFVVLEGLDGAGKTTAAKLFAKETGAVCMTTPSEALRAHRDVIVESLATQLSRQLFYLSMVEDASERIRLLLGQGGSVVLDRYYLSTQAYAAFRGSNLEVPLLEATLLIPDLTVFVEAPLEVRRARLLTRGLNPFDRETMSEKANARLIREYEARFGCRVTGRLLRI
ncbi:MAG: hypothetical protein CVU63_25250, partial [Deltaproteobacteria bacterium HGW-Deltaproteobacteria-20]